MKIKDAKTVEQKLALGMYVAPYTFKESWTDALGKVSYKKGDKAWAWYLPTSQFIPVRNSYGEYADLEAIAGYEVTKPNRDKKMDEKTKERLELFYAGMLGVDPLDYDIVNGLPVLKEDK